MSFKTEIYLAMQEVSTGRYPVTLFSFEEKAKHIVVVLRYNSHMKTRCKINKEHFDNDVKRMIRAVKEWQTAKKK